MLAHGGHVSPSSVNSPDQSYRLYDSNNIYYICGRLSDHPFCPSGQTV